MYTWSIERKVPPYAWPMASFYQRGADDDARQRHATTTRPFLSSPKTVFLRVTPKESFFSEPHLRSFQVQQLFRRRSRLHQRHAVVIPSPQLGLPEQDPPFQSHHGHDLRLFSDRPVLQAVPLVQVSLVVFGLALNETSHGEGHHPRRQREQQQQQRLIRNA